MKKKIPIDLALPWRLVVECNGKLSAVLNSEQHVVCGSLVCRHNSKFTLAEHQHIVKCVNLCREVL